MMPVIRAFTAFIEWTTGTTVEWFIAKSADTAKFHAQKFYPDNKYLLDATKNRVFGFIPACFLDLNLGDQHKDVNTAGNTGWYAATYSGYAGSVVFKQKALMGLGPAYALMFMCHEFTAHFFQKGINNNSTPHYMNASPHFQHCATGEVRESKCLNGFIEPGYANAMNALPFFTEWYETHKYAPIKMYKPKSK